MNCATTGLRPYVPGAAVPWTNARAVHLYRRMAFGAGALQIEADLDADPVSVVAREVDRALARPLTPEPDFAFKTRAEYAGDLSLLQSTLESDGYARDWILEMQTGGLRERMAWFWHNHFVTQFNTHESSSYTWQYHRLLQEYALGNFREFVRRMGLTPAMLVFLNGSENFADSPNENYARELYELFTLGDDNGYTQQDIVETARALTGYTNVTEEWGPIEFDPSTFDDGEKTIFGRTGNWGYDDVIDLLFEERGNQVARFIADKIYRRFVNPTVNTDFVDELAAIFLESNFDLATLMRTLYSSEHFYDAANLSTIIEGPLEHLLITYNEVGIEINGLSVFAVWAAAGEQGQKIFEPVDVAGWPGNRSWINTTSIVARQRIVEENLGSHTLFGFGILGETARAITSETEDVDIIFRDIVHHFVPRGLQFERDYEAALTSFKGEIPPQYFDNGIWTIDYWALPIQLVGLLTFLNGLPEFQLK